ncbi:hypothetical protein [Brevundimonas naejangsanensis]|uniref:hypothetical protein n=1 Tax=Brevundimonas naejangsanensis TaxID=588932 RepID=UPI00106D7501|nr:hypothetical protein [Brevundimonas naejangsanensis]QBQ49509.1 hypothetical protein E3U41_12900 [Brevundimonas naejangsanensis]
MGDGGLLGWATAALVKLDDEASGTLSRVLTAAPARRQAIFAALAAQEAKAGVFDAGEHLLPMTFAEVIRHGRAADILRHSFGKVPDGFSGLLERIGEHPLRAKDYLTLRDLAGSEDRRGTEALRHGERITCRKLEVLAALDPRWRHANTLERIDSGVEAMRFNSAVAFVQSVNSKATDEVVAGAIARMARSSSLPKLLDRFMRRADRLPPHPIQQGDNELRAVATTQSLLTVGRKYMNCLPHRLSEIAAGKMAIAEFRGEILLEFRPLSMGRGWMLWSAHGPRNELVALALRDEAAAACERHGVPHVPERPESMEWQSYRRFVRELEWG